MDNKRLLVLTVSAVLFMSAVAFVPRTETAPRYLRVTGVERTDSCLRLSVRLQNYPGYWVNIPSTTRLVSETDTTMQYRITGAETIALDRKLTMPSSGYMEGVLLFEKVPENVTVVTMAESDLADAGSNVFGLHLNEPDTRERPHIVTVDDILNMTGGEPEPWSGLDPERYAAMSFYDPAGTVHLRGMITDYSPRCGVSTFSIRTNDEITGADKVSVGDIDPDGTFALDIPVAYPQFNYFELGDIHKNLFLMPGDTLTVASCMAMRPDPVSGFAPEYFGFVGEPDDAVVVNILSDSLVTGHYDLTSLFWKYRVEESDSMKDQTCRAIGRVGTLLDTVAASLPELLGPLHISNYAKDILSACALSKIAMVMEDLEMNYMDVKGPGFRNNVDNTLFFDAGDPLDYTVTLLPRLKHRKLIYDNPLMLADGHFLVNRWEFSRLFRPQRMAAVGMVNTDDANPLYQWTDDFDGAYAVAMSYLDSLGVGDCFVTQLIAAKNVINDLSRADVVTPESMDHAERQVVSLIRHCDNSVMRGRVMAAYRDYVRKALIAEGADAGDGASVIDENSPGYDVLQRILSPYAGNVLYLDFWGIGCGPCRAGMIKQKQMLEKLSGEPFRALYIADASEDRAACEKWLSENGIGGEHIFISGDDWKRLAGLFDFSGIPYGVLIGKDGRVIATDYTFFSPDEIRLKHALSAPSAHAGGGAWTDTDGERINCHGGCIINADSLYYWYGEHRAGFDADYQKGVSCYSSPDLIHWTNEGIVLAVVEDTTSVMQRGCTIERPKVVYCPESGRYILWFHHELKGQGYAAAHVGVAESTAPTGPFTFLGSQRVNPGIYPLNYDDSLKGRVWEEADGEWWTPEWREAVAEGMFAGRDHDGGQMSRDMTVFVDDDGKAYHIYSSEENMTLHIAELAEDYTHHNGRYVRIFPGGMNEAPVMFRHGGTYWLICSGCTGWEPNRARMFSAPDPMGPWKEHPSPFVGEGSETTFGSQGAFALTDSDGRIWFYADEWHPDCLADSRYRRYEVRFGATGTPVITAE